MNKLPLNTNHIWATIREVIDRKGVTKRMVLKACENGKLDYEYVSGLKKRHTFIVMNEKYKVFSNTSKHRLDINALIAFTNKRLRGKV